MNPTFPTSTHPQSAETSGATEAPSAARGTRFLFKKQLVVLLLIVAARCAAFAIPDEIGEGGAAKKRDFLALPAQMGPWTGKNVKVDPVVYEVLQPDSVLQKRYKIAPTAHSPTPANVEVLVVYSRDPKGLHSPVVCMRAQGWTISNEEQRQVDLAGKHLTVEVLTGEQRGQSTRLAYCFTDAGEAVSGRIATFAKMMAARFMRRRIGAVEMQFAFDDGALLPDGSFRPEFKALMLQTAATVRQQLAAETRGT